MHLFVPEEVRYLRMLNQVASQLNPGSGWKEKCGLCHSHLQLMHLAEVHTVGLFAIPGINRANYALRPF